MSTQMIVRVEPDLKDRVSRLAKTEGKTVSEIVRELLTKYVQDRDMSAYVDDLWDRIGSKLSQSKADPENIQRIIREIRKK